MPGVCPRCLREVYFAEEKLALGKVWHIFCFSCRNCRKLLDSCTVATHGGELFCRNCCTRLFTPSVQPPSPPPTSDLTVEHRNPPFPSSRVPVSACDSFSDCCCCCCCPEDCSVAEVPSNLREYNRLDKQRLRGGGGEEIDEPEDFRLVEETRRCSEGDCSNLGIVSSITTLCNAPSSPTAVTTWYNRQHSASQSTFGGQNCVKRHSVRSSGTPIPCTPAANFRSNNSDCLNSNSNCVDGGKKLPGVRRPGSPYRPRIQQNQQQHLLQQQQSQSQSQQQVELPLQSREQEQVQKQEQHLTQQKDQELHHQNQRESQQQLKDIPCNRKSRNNRRHSPLRYSASDVPEEADSPTSESTTCRMKMPNDNNGNCNHSNVSPSSTPLNSQSAGNNPNNYTSSNGTPYETCYEMDDVNVPSGYTPGAGNASNYKNNCSQGLLEDGEQRSSNFDDEEDQSRLRGGCGGCGSRSGGCGTCGGCGPPIGPCPPRNDCREPSTSCGAPSCDPPCGTRPGCCAPAGCRPICRKPARSCCPPCTSEPQGCGGGGCCGGGCRGGCGKPGRLCMPLRPCSAPPCQPQVCRPRGSPCMPPRGCAPTPPCCKPPGVTFRPSCGTGGGGPCCRSKSPQRGCCGSSQQDDIGCGYCGSCKLPPGCECLGGGLDCQRCGRKVYQAEMQIASGVPYHNICFSCFCCRKPLEPLTYQENCGEIYCKHCYVRNFGPQGYGYGAGAGVLQTPM
ncbi:uncharacterized protein LOC105683687 [Athalia rosae]|uniref:uncharacterized protein LOC105683687 n=1 Tax=Athalia rosae TaxID=37344 RepID=UPI0020334DBD|nr:uncharacterized protein LOC105683687 [Athalia rosae]